jgi:hypothetical protein
MIAMREKNYERDASQPVCFACLLASVSPTEQPKARNFKPAKAPPGISIS